MKKIFYCLVFLLFLLVTCTIALFLIRHQQKIIQTQESFVPFINRRIRPYARNFRIYRDRNLEYVRNRLDRFGLGTFW